MFGANRLAFGILLVWLAGIGFFFAFHPGGVMIYDPDLHKGKGGERTVKNPAEVLGFLMSHHFGDGSSDQTPDQSGGSSVDPGGSIGGQIIGGPLTGGNAHPNPLGNVPLVP